jgi:NAD(P)H-dependent FMN reductase
MRALVIYDSRFGNTEQVARAIARGLGDAPDVKLARADEPPPAMNDVDLLVLGGPTQNHGLSVGLKTLLRSLARGALRGRDAATFDTRYRMARLISGSAARSARPYLRRAGCRLIAQAESFYVARDRPPVPDRPVTEQVHLEAGELDRARAWGAKLAARVARLG